MSELDPPVLSSAEQIRRHTFASVRRGFDPDQVRGYLKQIADQVDDLEAQLRDARLAAEAGASASSSAEPKTDPYQEVAARLARVLRTADQEAEARLAEARGKADKLVSAARAEADRVRLDAQSRAEEVRGKAEAALSQARLESDQTLSDLTDRRQSVVGELRDFQRLLEGMAQQFEAAIRGEPVDAETEGDESEPEAKTEAARPTGAPDDEAVVDPRYEDLWASPDVVDLTLSDDVEIVETEERELGKH